MHYLYSFGTAFLVAAVLALVFALPQPESMAYACALGFVVGRAVGRP